MEIQLFHYQGFLAGYIKKTLEITNDGFIIKMKIPGLKKFQSKKYSLENAKIGTTEVEGEFYIDVGDETHYFKANSEQERKILVDKITGIIKKIYQETLYTKDFQFYLSEISKKVNENRFDPITTTLTMLMNYFLEFQNKITECKRFVMSQKISNKISQKFINYLDNMMDLETEMRNTYDELVKNIYDYRDDIDPAYAEEKIINMKELMQAGFIKDESKKDTLKITEKNEKEPNIYVINENQPLVYTPDPLYDFTRRTDFAGKLKISPNLIQELIKAVSARQKFLPIFFNEPLSMLQKECEKFYYSNFLDKAVEEELPENKFLYLSAFIIGESSFNKGRTLKPFLPLLGETYEYCDNQRKFRYFAEQCFRKNHTSAFYCEGQGWLVNGDTRNQYNLKIWKGCGEIEFGSKTHVKIFNKQTKKYETFLYNRPLTQMKGFLNKNLHYDFSGTVTITNIDQPNIQCEINFIEETRKVPIGGFDGKITKDGEVVYLLKGNWFKELNYTDKDGNNPVKLLEISDSKFLYNSENNYSLPEYSYGLNQITEELKKILPPTDTRLRPDQRAYESGDEEEGQRIKAIIEGFQISRQERLNTTGKEYKPIYFENFYDENSKDFYYKYKGDYWGQRKTGKYIPKKFIVFNLDPDKEVDEA